MIRTVSVRKLFVAASAFAFLAGGAAPAVAQVSDHLKCYRIRDSISNQPHTLYNADLMGLVAQPSCRIKTRGKMLCVATTKTGVTPAPPGGGPSSPAAAGKFVCYRARCPRQALPNQALSDQFGARSVSLRTTALLCAPASPSGAFLDSSDRLF